MSETKMAEWNEMLTQWLEMFVEQLCRHAVREAHGHRGVIVAVITKNEMAAAFAMEERTPSGTTVKMQMAPPIWMPAEAFLDLIRTDHVDPTTADRYRPLLEAMDPYRDAAFYLSSAPDGSDGGVYSRWIFRSPLPNLD